MSSDNSDDSDNDTIIGHNEGNYMADDNIDDNIDDDSLLYNYNSKKY
jgi:hypothetical protein